MKKLLLLTLTAITLIACADNGVSAPSDSTPRQICYDKKLTYQDVTSPEYRDYEAEWNEKACVSKHSDNRCRYWDYDYILTVRECLENVDTH